MEYQDKISSYIENELTPEAEQEFLISLAASEALRRSFRSELIMKNIMREDERASVPPRKMRNGVFAAVGLATAVAESDVVDAAKTVNTGFIMTKLNALIGAVAVIASMSVGYFAHGLIEPSTQVTPATHVEQQSQPQLLSAPTTTSTSTAPTLSASSESAPLQSVESKNSPNQTVHAVKSLKQAAKQTPVVGAGGSPTQTTAVPSDLDVNPVVTKPAK